MSSYLRLAIRGVLARRPVRYAFTHPVLLVSVVFPSVRVIFSFRLVRSVFRRGHLGRFLVAAAVLVLNGAVIVYLFERHAPKSSIHTLGESLWWSVVTVTASPKDTKTTGVLVFSGGTRASPPRSRPTAAVRAAPATAVAAAGPAPRSSSALAHAPAGCPVRTTRRALRSGMPPWPGLTGPRLGQGPLVPGVRRAVP